MPILDHNGRPLNAAKAPRAPFNISAVTKIDQPAQRFASMLMGRVRPERMAYLLAEASRGNAEAYLTLAEEMEEKELQYAACLQTRKLAVAGVDPIITPANKTARAAVIASQFEELVVRTPQFEQMIYDLTDALGKGYSVIEPIWDTTTTPWTFAEFRWHDPRLFVWDRATLRELRIYSPDSIDGVPMPAGQFMIHLPRIKTGIPIRGGLARVAAVAYCFKSFTLADWAAFCEVYGMPLRVAHFDPETSSDEEIAMLRTALANIGHDAAALLPDSMSIDVLDARRPASNGKNVFEGLANYWDAALRHMILGQPTSTDDGATKSPDAQERVQTKYAIADARTVKATIVAGVMRPWVLFNYGEDAARRLLPLMRMPVEPAEDLVKYTNALLPWVRDAGMKVKASEVRERFDMSEPEDGDEVLEVIAVPKPGLAPAKDTTKPLEPKQNGAGT